MTSLKQEQLELNGATLEIYQGGAGSPVVCCQHPHSSNLERFRWYAGETSFIYMVVRGLGNSSPITKPSDLTYLQAVHDLEALRRKLGIGRWVVQGFSAGSQVALLYALTYPDALAGLITIAGYANYADLLANPDSLCSPKHPSYRSDLEALRRKEIQRVPAVLSSSDHYWVQINPQAWGFFHKDTPMVVMPGSELWDRLKAAFEEATRFDVEDRLKTIQVPTLVVAGRHDPVVPLKESLAIHASIPTSKWLELENSGHGAEGDDEAIFRHAVLQFLAQLDP